MLNFLKEKYITTQAGFLAGAACGASAASFLVVSFPMSTKEYFALGCAYLFLSWIFFNIDHKQKVKEFFKAMEEDCVR